MARRAGQARIRVMVVHSHPTVCDGLAACLGLEPDIEVVGTASTCGIALDMAAALSPDLVLIGRSTPWTGGMAATRFLVTAQPEVVVVILSGTAGPEFFVEAVQSGAKDYLSLDTPPSDIARTVRDLVHL
jgi:DNA-binding NarL/FixJ family response regulator